MEGPQAGAAPCFAFQARSRSTGNDARVDAGKAREIGAMKRTVVATVAITLAGSVAIGLLLGLMADTGSAPTVIIAPATQDPATATATPTREDPRPPASPVGSPSPAGSPVTS